MNGIYYLLGLILITLIIFSVQYDEGDISVITVPYEICQNETALEGWCGENHFQYHYTVLCEEGGKSAIVVKRDGFFDNVHIKTRSLYDVELLKQESIQRFRRGVGAQPATLPTWHTDIIFAGTTPMHTGQGIFVSVIDDGVEMNHPDIEHSVMPILCYDFNLKIKHDGNPKSIYDKHGTRCAGEIASLGDRCSAQGLSPGVTLGSSRILGASISDAIEAAALNYRADVFDIYSNSWGPSDDGRVIEGPGTLTRKVLEINSEKGREGKGTIFVFASGNGGALDNCNFDGYVNSPHTLAVSAFDRDFSVPDYVESCTCTFLSMPSSPSRFSSNPYIASTDIGASCTKYHGGTSAAAPLAAGLLALLLEARSNLTLTDIKWLLALHTDKDRLNTNDWTVNAAGLAHSRRLGFGWGNYPKLLAAALAWNQVLEFPSLKYESVFSYEGTLSILATEINFLEEVVIMITYAPDTPMGCLRGDCEIFLKSPSQTTSILITPRLNDRSKGSLVDWKLMSVEFWGESPIGSWGISANCAKVYQWKLIVRGQQAVVF